MKAVVQIIASLVLVLLLSTATLAQDIGWPRQRTENGNILITYQPQVDEWKDYRELDWRMAISLTPVGGKPAVGVVELHAQTVVDNDNKMVLISNIQIKRTHFPSLDPSAAAKMDALTKRFLPKTVTMTLHQLVACVPKPEKVQTVQLKNDPPEIFISYKPAILLDVDGQPVRTAIKKAKLEFVVNTRWPLFFDPESSLFYWLAGEQWFAAAALEGPWAVTKKLPAEMTTLAKEPEWKKLKKFIPPPPAKPNAVVPVVFYSSKPADIILFNGNPVFKEIAGTKLQYATNTVSYIFLDTLTKQYYYLTAGRWFRAESLDGPWTFATYDLPADFTRIPPSIPAAQVLASVPGTEEAKDAVLLAQVPVMVTVNPTAAAKNIKLVYAGEPDFIVIQGTSLYYAMNTPQAVIKVDNLYYLCYQGIWFVSASPKGPWQTAASVPKVIYTIPPSSAVYNVIYVTQVMTPDGEIQASYTAGYTGAYVTGTTTTVVIVGGTGYYYPPYVGYYPGYPYPYYYPPPYTYGYAAYYHSPTGAYGVAQTAYGPYGSATRTASYNPYTGTYARTASVSTPYGSASAGRAYNPYTGAAAATRQGSNAYSSWGSSVVTKGGKTAQTGHYTTDKGTVGAARTSSGGKAVGVSTDRGSTAVAKTGSGDVYAGHDGNAYKKTDDGWQKYEDGSWSNVEKPASKGEAKQTAEQRSAGESGASRESNQQQAKQQGSSGESERVQKMQQESQNRQRGEQESQRSQQYQGSDSKGTRSSSGVSGGSGSSGSGAVSRGGGRGRR